MLYYLYPFEGQGVMVIDCVDGEQPSWAEIPIDVMPGTKYFAIAADKDANGDIQGEVRFITLGLKLLQNHLHSKEESFGRLLKNDLLNLWK